MTASGESPGDEELRTVVDLEVLIEGAAQEHTAVHRPGLGSVEEGEDPLTAGSDEGGLLRRASVRI
jgi:hypothetical protein